MKSAKLFVSAAIFLCTSLNPLAALAAPEKVLQYWPAQPGEFSYPAAIAFAGKNIRNPEAALLADEQAATLVPGSDLVIDFGEELGGFFALKLKLNQPAKITLTYSEAEKFARTGLDPVALASSSFRRLLSRTYKVEKSGWFEDPVLMGGARYLRIRVERGEIELDALRCRKTFFPCDPLNAGWFLSSDELLNQIWYASYYTVCLDTIRSDQGGKSGREKIGEGDWVIVDGAKRDRLVWSGDMGIAGPVVYVSSGRYDIVRNTLLSLAHWQFPDGLYPACSRAELGASASKMFLEYSLWQVVNSFDYYLYSGDIDFLKETYPGILKAMEFHHSRTNRDGIIIQNPLAGGMNYSFSIFRTGPVAFVNALYYLALNDAAKLAVAMNDLGQAQLFLARSDKLAENFDRYFWDRQKLAYRDVSFDPNHFALDGNALSVFSGLAGPEKTQAVIDFINRELARPWGDRQFDYPYFVPQKIPLVQSHNSQFVMPFINAFDALARFQAGRDTEALDLLRRCWGNMVKKDPNFTTWEWVGKNGNPDMPATSLAHAWSAGAAFILSERILGIRPLEPGYASYLIEPHPAGLSSAQGAVPTPRGLVEVSWRDDDTQFAMELSLPLGKGPTVSLPRSGEGDRVSLDGELIFEEGKAIANPKVEGARADEKHLSFELKDGGKYQLVLAKKGKEMP